MQKKSNPLLYLQRKKAFVDAAAELIKKQPFDSISIRKIADTAGFHNSTIYSYFQDADWLLALACVRYLQPYSDQLAQIDASGSTSRERFYAIWTCFCQNAFANPSLYYNFFFGKYRDHLTDLLNEYYELFPDSLNNHSPLISTMFHGNTMHDRCLSILQPLSNDPSTRVRDDNVYMINFIIVSTLEEYLAQLIREESGRTTENLTEVDEMQSEGTDSFFQKTQSPIHNETKYVRMLHFVIDK